MGSGTSGEGMLPASGDGVTTDDRTSGVASSCVRISSSVDSRSAEGSISGERGAAGGERRTSVGFAASTTVGTSSGSTATGFGLRGLAVAGFGLAGTGGGLFTKTSSLVLASLSETSTMGRTGTGRVGAAGRDVVDVGRLPRPGALGPAEGVRTWFAGVLLLMEGRAGSVRAPAETGVLWAASKARCTEAPAVTLSDGVVGRLPTTDAGVAAGRAEGMLRVEPRDGGRARFVGVVGRPMLLPLMLLRLGVVALDEERPGRTGGRTGVRASPDSEGRRRGVRLSPLSTREGALRLGVPGLLRASGRREIEFDDLALLGAWGPFCFVGVAKFAS